MAKTKIIRQGDKLQRWEDNYLIAPEPFVPVELTPEQIYEEQVTAKMVEISDRELRVKAVAELDAVALVK